MPEPGVKAINQGSLESGFLGSDWPTFPGANKHLSRSGRPLAGAGGVKLKFYDFIVHILCSGWEGGEGGGGELL